jgi:hypothetical protein
MVLNDDLGGLLGGQFSAEAGAEWKRKWTDTIDSQATLLTRRGRKSFTSALQAPWGNTHFAERGQTSETLARTSMQIRLSSKLTAQIDGELARNRLTTHSELSFAGFPIPLPNARATIREGRQDAGIQLNWKAANRIDLEAALHHERATIRADTDQQFRRNYPYWRPRLQALLSPFEHHRLRIRVEREVGQLDFVNFAAAAQLDKGAVAAGNVAIRPQSAWIAEGRWEWDGGPKTNIALTVRRSWLRDVVDRVPVDAGDGSPTFDAPGNIGRGSQTVAILAATMPLDALGVPRSDLKIDVSWRRSRVTDPANQQRRSISAEKPYEITATFHQDLPRLKASWGVTADAGWRSATYLFNEVDRNSQTFRLGAFVDWNPSATTSWRFELSDTWGRRTRRTVDLFGGERGQAALLYREFRIVSVGPAGLVRFRKQF